MPSRIALRIYLLGIVQILVVFFAMEASKRIEQQQHPLPIGDKQARYAAVDVARVYGDRAALDAEVARLAVALDWSVEVRDPAGAIVAQAKPASQVAQQTPLRRGEQPIALPDGRTATLAYAVHLPARPTRYTQLVVLVFVIAGITAFLTARTLTRPLAALTDVTRAFGPGKLDVRARMKRKDESGEVANAFDDMADRVARLLLAERELLANVSHELRTPLARIRVALDLAAEGDVAAARRYLGEIGADLSELERLVADVLTASRLDLAGRAAADLPLRPERLVAADLLSRAAERFRAAHAGRALELRLGEGLPDVDGDPALLRRALDNLLDNAAKYSEAPEPVVLLAAADHGALAIEVRDRGIGIDAADLPRLFTPFFRTDRSRARGSGGVGLGLALAKRIVDAHGGTLAVASEPGRGTTGRLVLPAAPAAPPAAATPQ